MTWNHRVIKEGDVYSVREVLYEDTNLISWSAEPSELTGESVEELKAYYEQMAVAFSAPVIEVSGDAITKSN